MPLRTMARCFRGIAIILASTSSEIGLRKVTYRLLRGQETSTKVRLRSSKRTDTKTVRETASLLRKHLPGIIARCDNSPVDGPGDRHQPMPEQHAPDLRQRKQASTMPLRSG